MPKAAVDIGSNSLLMVIGNKGKNGAIEILGDFAEISSLGKSVGSTGLFLDESMQKTENILIKYRDILLTHKLNLSEEVFLVATEASRRAKNAKAFFEQIEHSLGLKIKIISAEEEGLLAAKGVELFIHQKYPQHKKQNKVMMDLGGASTELIQLSTSPLKIHTFLSLASGSVLTKEWLDENLFDLKFEKLFKDKEIKAYSNSEVICISGTLLSYAQIILNLSDFEESKINGYQCSLTDLSEALDLVRKQDKKTLLLKFPNLSSRYDQLYSGGHLALKILSKINCSGLLFSTYGLRHGLLWDQL